MFGDEAIPKAHSTVNLGIHRQVNDRPAITKNVRLGRRTIYSLMGACVYGGSVLSLSKEDICDSLCHLGSGSSVLLYVRWTVS